MGQKLIEYYDVVQKKGGLKAALRLAMLTKISVTKAKEIPDTAELIRNFEVAVKEIFGVDFNTLKNRSN